MTTFNALFDSLTAEQRAAVTAAENHIRVIAGAGSGKTRTLAMRFLHLVAVDGIPNSEILCLTFTNKAAKEMKDCIASLFPEAATGAWITTIHSFCARFLREEIHRLGFPQNFLIFDETDMKALIKAVLDDNHIDRTMGTAGNYLKILAEYKANTPYVHDLIRPTASVKADLPIPTKIILRQRKHFALDFDDLLYYTLYVLNTFTDAREKWQKHFQHIMIDEAQDCSKPDWQLCTILSGLHENIFFVGDADQAIYEWRGAHPDLFVGYTPDRDLFLRNNFRSRPGIVHLADTIIANNRNRLPRASVTMRPGGEFRPTLFHCDSEKDEANTLTMKLLALHDFEGVQWGDIAVLFRASYLSRSIEQAFIRNLIPYSVWGGTRFFERKEIKDALCYLRLVANDDDIAFKRVVNEPARGIGKKTISKIEAYASENGCSLFSALTNNLTEVWNSKAEHFVRLILDAREKAKEGSISTLLEDLLEESGLMAEYRTDTDEDRLENIQQLLVSISTYEEEHINDGISLNSYLQEIALFTNSDSQPDSDTVKLMTVHQSKGLEFPVVWIYGLNEGVFPSARTIRERGNPGLEEERRLMYVACTRAKDRLFLSESEGYNVQNSFEKYPSRFLEEAEDENGPMYDTQGIISSILWDGTERMIREGEMTWLPLSIGARKCTKVNR